MGGAVPPLLNTPSWRGAQLQHRENFTFTFTLPYHRLFRLGFRTKILYALRIFPVCATCAAHLIFLHFITCILYYLKKRTSYEAHCAVFSSHFLHLRSKYSPQHTILKHPQSMLLS